MTTLQILVTILAVLSFVTLVESEDKFREVLTAVADRYCSMHFDFDFLGGLIKATAAINQVNLNHHEESTKRVK